MNTKFILKICTFFLSMMLCMIPFSLDAKKNNVSCQQMHDVIDEHGQRFMQFVFSSPNDKYTVGYVESYDDPSKGSFFCYLHPIVVQNQNVISMQQLQQSHSLSVTNMKQRALANSPVTQRQQIDILVASGRMSVDQAMMHYQQIEYAPLIEQAKKQAKNIRKQDKKKKNKLKHVQESKNNTSSPVVPNKSHQVKAPQTPTTNHPSTAQNQLIQKLKNIQTQQSTKNYQDKTDIFQNVMEQRSKALQASITDQKNTHEYHAINSLTAGFLQAQGIDILPFTQGQGLPIQHQITGELVNILDAVAQLTENNFSIPLNSLAQYCAQLASLTQQANQKADLQQALNGADCCHGLQHYLQGMVAGIGQAYQQFQTALDYFDTIADRYGTLIVQHAVQGAGLSYGLEAVVSAGIITAPVATTAATAALIGATAYVMAPVCLQASMNLKNFGWSCMQGDWNKIRQDIDTFGHFLSKPQTIARMAEIAGGAAMPTPTLNHLINQILSLRPVITSVQDASGKALFKLYLMTKSQRQKVYHQALELLQLPEFTNFTATYKKIFGTEFFALIPEESLSFAGMNISTHSAQLGISPDAFSAMQQTRLTTFYNQAQKGLLSKIVTSKQSVIDGSITQILEDVTSSTITDQTRFMQSIHDYTPMHQLRDIIQREIAQESQKNLVPTDLTLPISDVKFAQLKELSSQIRQLQDLAKYTNNFTNVENLIIEDICYLNRIYELQTYRTQIKNFLETHKPYFMHDGIIYPIEDIASYHIHAGDYYRKDPPKGGHSNPRGKNLDYFQPTINKQNSLGAKEIRFYNSRNENKIKDSSIYPETWSEYNCDLKAINLLQSQHVEITERTRGTLTCIGKTSEDLDIIVHYDIAHKRIKSHYPNSEKF